MVYYGRYLPLRQRASSTTDTWRCWSPSRAHEFVMRANTIEYHAPARFDDLIEVFIRRILQDRSTSVEYEHAAYARR